MSAGVLTMTDRGAEATPTALRRDLMCRHRGCGTLLARVIGATLVCLDGTRIGPVQRGMVVARPCPRCKQSNRFWL